MMLGQVAAISVAATSACFFGNLQSRHADFVTLHACNACISCHPLTYGCPPSQVPPMAASPATPHRLLLVRESLSFSTSGIDAVFDFH